jgi:hypothetical protein
VQHDVDAGRAVLNLSEWDRPQAGAAQAAASVQTGRMPPSWAVQIDGRLALSAAERAELASGLQLSLAGGSSAPTNADPLLALSPAVFAVLGVGLIGLAYIGLRERHARPDRGG